MTVDKDDRKRPHLRLVVNNADKRGGHAPRGEETFISLNDLVAMRDEVRPHFYRGLEPAYVKAYETIERFVDMKGWPCGLDAQHGPLIVLPAEAILEEPGGENEGHPDEMIVYITEDLSGQGLCLSLEMILPFYSEEEAVMEDALLFSPVFQYGTLFLEENQQDQALDLIYRFGFPICPPALTATVLGRLFAIAAFELKEILRSLAEYPEGS